MRKFRKFKILLPAVLIACTGMVALAVSYRPAAAKKTVVVRHLPAPAKPVTYDRRQLADLSKVLELANCSESRCTVSGSIDVRDGANTAASLHQVPFVFSRKNSDFYYKLGSVEVIHREGLNISIDHEHKQIAVSRQEIRFGLAQVSVPALEQMLKNEGYQLRVKSNGASKTLSLLNETNVTCKEFSLTYDTVSLLPQRIYTRLSDISDLMNREKERTVEVRFEAVSREVNLGGYPGVKDVLQKMPGGWSLTPAYQHYELILI